MDSVEYLVYRAGRDRDGQVLRAVADYRPVSAHRLAWEERNRGWIAEAEQIRLLREAGISTPGTSRQLRATLGAWLVQFGEWLLNRSTRRGISDAISTL